MRKKTLIGLAIVLATVLGSGIAFAHYWGWGGYGGHMMAPGYGGPMMAPGYGGFMMSPGYSGSCWGNEKGFSGKASSLTKKDMESVLRNEITLVPTQTSKLERSKIKGPFSRERS